MCNGLHHRLQLVAQSSKQLFTVKDNSMTSLLQNFLKHVEFSFLQTSFSSLWHPKFVCQIVIEKYLTIYLFCGLQKVWYILHNVCQMDLRKDIKAKVIWKYFNSVKLRNVLMLPFVQICSSLPVCISCSISFLLMQIRILEQKEGEELLGSSGGYWLWRLRNRLCSIVLFTVKGW